MLIIHTLIEFDDQYLASQVDIINALKGIWATDLYKVFKSDFKITVFNFYKKFKHLQSCESNVSCDLWHLVAKVLLHFFSHHTNDIDLLFQLLRALCLRFIPDFQFLRDFLQNTVAQSFTVEWKRTAFFHFVENFGNDQLSQDLKAKVRQRFSFLL